MRFSATRLKSWQGCQLQAKFKYVDHLPTRQGSKAAFGTCVHAALALYNETADLDRAIATFVDHWQNPEKLNVAIDVWNRNNTWGGLRTRGVEILREYHDKQKWNSRQILAVEHRFLVPFGVHELTGVVDLAEIKRSGKGKDTLRIVDYKTSSYKPSVADVSLDLQFCVYDYAATCREFWVGNGPDFPGLPNGEWTFETLQGINRRCIWYHLWGNTEVDAGSRDDNDYGRLYRLCCEIERAHNLEVFIPHVSGDTCTFCDFANGPCPVTIPTAAQMLAEEGAWI